MLQCLLILVQRGHSIPQSQPLGWGGGGKGEGLRQHANQESKQGQNYHWLCDLSLYFSICKMGGRGMGGLSLPLHRWL